MTMKTRILLIALAVFALGLLTSSCGKADFLEGSKWTREDDDYNYEFLFSTATRVFYIEFKKSDEGVNYYAQGKYSGKRDIINIELKDGSHEYTFPGRIKGDKMTLEGFGQEWVFKKVKK